MISTRQFLGTGEHTFALPAAQLVELEALTKIGIFGLFDRVLRSESYFLDLVETIRLAAIGGGMTPVEAKTLVERYVEARPISESYPVALAILSAVMFGTDDTAELDTNSTGEAAR